MTKLQDHKQKSPNRAEMGFSKTIHQDIVNSTYFNMILTNQECAKFCCELLEQFDSLLNQYTSDNPSVFKGSELNVFISLYNLNNENIKRS